MSHTPSVLSCQATLKCTYVCVSIGVVMAVFVCGLCRSDKDEEITALREEGEKLSKQQLQSSNTIKKLRAKDQENRKIIAGLR